ncbi:MAG: sigma-70 family RNA polymerase sigma factor [Phaeodactylibacter sp.]|nr:sigma-70 family RNA polymerase sigma factor [Phaeodactylibacter sp.]MCB9048105.1 sigma-70 family RNA polymerase sigma factor [Lewinellaceae bacterium]
MVHPTFVSTRRTERITAGKVTQNTLNFNSVYQQFAGVVYNKCLAILKEETAAEDVSQEIFIKIFLKFSEFRRESKFSTWIYSITYNSCIDYLRNKKNATNRPLEELTIQPITTEEVPDPWLVKKKMAQLGQVLELLNPNDKNILILKYQENRRIPEIADALQLSESAVKMRIKRAKAKVQKLRKELFTTDDRAAESLSWFYDQ